MANPIEAARDYMGELGNRVIGRAAWNEAMRRPAFTKLHSGPGESPWDIKIMEHGAPFLAIGELTFPVFSRLLVAEKTPKQMAQMEKHPYLFSAKIIAAISADVALLVPTIWLFPRNPLAAAGLKLATNMVVNAGLDAAGAVANRIRNRRPSTTLTA